MNEYNLNQQCPKCKKVHEFTIDDFHPLVDTMKCKGCGEEFKIQLEYATWCKIRKLNYEECI